MDITGWVPPTIDTGETLMYPALLDADSPDLGNGSASGLSYALVGNKSLALYYVVARAYIFRLPVAWVSSDTASISPNLLVRLSFGLTFGFALHISCVVASAQASIPPCPAVSSQPQKLPGVPRVSLCMQDSQEHGSA